MHVIFSAKNRYYLSVQCVMNIKFRMNAPLNYLDFASPVSGLGSKMGMNAEVTARMDALYTSLGL